MKFFAYIKTLIAVAATVAFALVIHDYFMPGDEIVSAAYLYHVAWGGILAAGAWALALMEPTLFSRY